MYISVVLSNLHVSSRFLKYILELVCGIVMFPILLQRIVTLLEDHSYAENLNDRISVIRTRKPTGYLAAR